MKKSRLMTGVLIALMIFPALIEAAQISFFIGRVTITRDGIISRPSIGRILKAGDIIETASSANIEISYNDGSKITVKPNSKVQFGSKSIANSEHISLIQGNLNGNFNKLSKMTRSHKVVTPTVVCAVRGTDFTVTVSKTGVSRVDLAKGKLQLDNPAGESVLNSNQQMQAGIAMPPMVGPVPGDISEWQKKEDQRLKQEPAEIGNSYKTYTKQFAVRTSEDSEKVNTCNSALKDAKTPEKIDTVGKEIDHTADKIENDLLLNETSMATISDILKDYGRRKDRIYHIFNQVKEECNKVKEQQERNFRDLEAVRKSYIEAKEKIRGKFDEDKKKINDVDMNKFKPSFEFNK